MFGWSCGNKGYQPLQNNDFLHDLFLVALAGQRLLDDLHRTNRTCLYVLRLPHLPVCAVAQLHFDHVFFSNIVAVLHDHVREAEVDLRVAPFDFILVFTCWLRRRIFGIALRFFASTHSHYSDEIILASLRGQKAARLGFCKARSPATDSNSSRRSRQPMGSAGGLG